jgi:hypothetical protein
MLMGAFNVGFCLPYAFNYEHVVNSYFKRCFVKAVLLLPFVEKWHEHAVLLSCCLIFVHVLLQQHCWSQKQKEGTVLWLEDVQSAVKQASDEVHDAKVGMLLQSQYLLVCEL